MGRSGVGRLDLFDRQTGRRFDFERLKAFGESALEAVLAVPEPAGGGGTLGKLPVVEVTIVGDEEISRVHEDFMDIPGPTDVITFDHGEIIISIDHAVVQGAENGVSLDRELALYLVHGLLHLRGYDDQSREEAATMSSLQEALLDRLWQPLS